MRSSFLLMLAYYVSGCAIHQPLSPEMAPAQVGIVNHTGNYIYSASVEGSGGANMARWGAGGAEMCCASIPAVWSPGISMLVRWDMPDGHTHIIKEKMIEVEKYDKPGSIFIHFFSNDEIRLVVSVVGPQNPNHPIPYDGEADISIKSK